jgi:pimeloyl-ACP methyl ester carboxylesterase
MNIQKILFSFLDRVWPSKSAQIAYQFMSNPQVRKLRDFEEKVLDQADSERLNFQGFDLIGYRWHADAGKKALLVHGWEGQIGNFSELINLLGEKDYQVLGYDAPSHGRSSSGETSMFQYGELIAQLIEQYKPDVVISHSFGSVGTMYALYNYPGQPLENWIMLTTPNNFKDRIEMVKNYLGITDRTVSRLYKLIESDTGQNIDQLNMEIYAQGVSQLKKALIIHSRSDKVLSIEDARKTHKSLKQSELIELDGLGHYGILRSQELKDILSERL